MFTFVAMTKDEVFKEITTPLKWYEPYYTAQYACILKQRYRNRTLGPDALGNLFNRFGYSKIEIIEQWEKL